jgi:hypothetical protein
MTDEEYNTHTFDTFGEASAFMDGIDFTGSTNIICSEPYQVGNSWVVKTTYADEIEY